MTIGGFHTVHELSDFWRALSYVKSRFAQAFRASTPALRKSDPDRYLALSVAQSHFDAKVADILPRVTSALASYTADTTPTWDHATAIDLHGDVFDDLAAVWHGTDPGGVGGFNEMVRSLGQAATVPGVYEPTFDDLPQPSAPDFDLDAYVAADAGVKRIEAAVESTGNLTLVLVVCLLAGMVIARR